MMHRVLLLAISISSWGGIAQAFDVDEWQPVDNGGEEQGPTLACTVARAQMKELIHAHLAPIAKLPKRALRVMAYLKVLSSLCEDTTMAPLDRLFWAHIAREEVEACLVEEVGLPLSEIDKDLPRNMQDSKESPALRATVEAARMVRNLSLDSLDGMAQTERRIFEYMERAMPDLLTIGEVSDQFQGDELFSQNEIMKQMIAAHVKIAHERADDFEKKRKEEIINLSSSLSVVSLLLCGTMTVVFMCCKKGNGASS
jgi:hypothetical protein